MHACFFCVNRTWNRCSCGTYCCPEHLAPHVCPKCTHIANIQLRSRIEHRLVPWQYVEGEERFTQKVIQE